MRFKPVASSSDGNLSVAECDGVAPLVLDCGLPWAKMSAALDHKATQVAGVLVTHGHGDHAGGALAAATHGLDVYVTPGTFSEINVPDVLRPRFRNAEPGAWLDVGGWKVRSFPVDHDAAEPVGFYVCAPDGGRLVYITDAADCALTFPKLTHIAVECNYWDMLLGGAPLLESVKARIRATHMEVDRCIAFLRRQDLSNVQEIWLMHLSAGNSDAAAFQLAVAQQTGRPTFIAEHAIQPPAVPITIEGVIANIDTVLDEESNQTVLMVRLDGFASILRATDPKLHGYLMAGLRDKARLACIAVGGAHGEPPVIAELRCIGHTRFLSNEPIGVELKSLAENDGIPY